MWYNEGLHKFWLKDIKSMKICMIGTGYVGLVSGICFADLGNDVICVDKDIEKINNLNNGILPIYEPGLEELFNKNCKLGRIKFSSNIKDSINKSNIVLICVGTPTRKNDNSANLNQVFSVTNDIAKSIKKFKDGIYQDISDVFCYLFRFFD